MTAIYAVARFMALILIGALLSCAPAGYHYGSWSDGPQAAFALSANAQAQGFHYDNGEPVQPTKTSENSQLGSAINKYCATAAPVACSLYVRKIGRCPALGANAYSILAYERKMRQSGATPKQAMELAINTFERSPQIAYDDIEHIAALAADFPDTQSPDVFRDKILNRCIDAAAN
jgi:hypothetical protein